MDSRERPRCKRFKSNLADIKKAKAKQMSTLTSSEESVSIPLASAFETRKGQKNQNANKKGSEKPIAVSPSQTEKKKSKKNKEKKKEKKNKKSEKGQQSSPSSKKSSGENKKVDAKEADCEKHGSSRDETSTKKTTPLKKKTAQCLAPGVFDGQHTSPSPESTSRGIEKTTHNERNGTSHDGVSEILGASLFLFSACVCSETNEQQQHCFYTLPSVSLHFPSSKTSTSAKEVGVFLCSVNNVDVMADPDETLLVPSQQSLCFSEERSSVSLKCEALPASVTDVFEQGLLEKLEESSHRIDHVKALCERLGCLFLADKLFGVLWGHWASMTPQEKQSCHGKLMEIDFVKQKFPKVDDVNNVFQSSDDSGDDSSNWFSCHVLLRLMSKKTLSSSFSGDWKGSWNELHSLLKQEIEKNGTIKTNFKSMKLTCTNFVEVGPGDGVDVKDVVTKFLNNDSMLPQMVEIPGDKEQLKSSARTFLT